MIRVAKLLSFFRDTQHAYDDDDDDDDDVTVTEAKGDPTSL